MAGRTDEMDTHQFEEHMWKLTTNAFTLVSVIFGNELELFDIIQKANTPLTSSEIAHQAGLKERYVREWLGGMTAAQIVEIDGPTSTYSIHEGHYNIIKETACRGESIRSCLGRFNMAKLFFKTAGPWGCDFDQEDFWAYFERFRDNNCVEIITRDILPSLENSAYLKQSLDTGIKVLDIGCGTGPITVEFARRFPNSSFTGLDNSDKALKLAKDRSNREGIPNIRFLNGDAHNLPAEMSDQYDLVLIFEVLHNLPDPNKALVEVKRVLKPNGKIMIYEHRIHSNHADNVGNMTASYFYTNSIYFCLPCSLSGESKVGYGVGWGEEEMLKTIGSYFTFENKFEFSKLYGLFIYSK